MFETIIVPLDGSELAEQALDRAAELAAKVKARVVLVQAVESLAQRMTSPPAVMESPAAAAASVEILQEAIDAEKEQAEHYLAGVRDKLTARGLQAEAYVGEGAASDVILKLAQDKQSDLIVMSTHGRGGLGRLVFGSVADAILRHSQVPVMLVRVKKAD
jgi:nucleotide-binding universal stress UspA family protein